MIKIRWALLCNDVEKNDDNTSGNLIGVTEGFVSPTIPFSIGQLVVALGLQFSGNGISELSVILRFVETGDLIFRSEPNDHRLEARVSSKAFNFIYPIYIHNIVLPKFGEYYLEILIDGRTAHFNSYNLRQGERFETKL